MDRGGPFISKETWIDIARYPEDNDVLIDVNNFRLVPYIKHLIKNRHNLEEKDSFPFLALFLTLAFFMNELSLRYIWYGWIVKDIVD